MHVLITVTVVVAAARSPLQYLQCKTVSDSSMAAFLWEPLWCMCCACASAVSPCCSCVFLH
jgi:hypothetical protein